MGVREWAAERALVLPETKKYSGRLIIVGDGRCVWDDLEKLGCASQDHRGSVKSDADFMCINAIGQRFPGQMRHWYSNDGRWLAHLVKSRRPEYAYVWPEKPLTHCCIGQADIVWPWPGHGSSGLNAVFTGLALGYEEIILCGIPLDDAGHDGEPPWRRTNFTREVAGQINNPENRFWKEARLKVFEGRVRSMSGRTREWLS